MVRGVNIVEQAPLLARAAGRTLIRRPAACRRNETRDPVNNRPWRLTFPNVDT